MGSNFPFTLNLKAVYNKHPYIMLVVAFMISSILMSFAMRLFELPYYEDEEDHSK
jgi:hypothetical protein